MKANHRIREKNMYILNMFAQLDFEEFKHKKIMVIDDCRDVLIYAQHTLKILENVSIQTYEDEFEAMKQFVDIKPDLVIMDMKLKNLDGYKVSKRLKSLSMFKVPIIYISADRKEKNNIENKESEPVLFLKKPLEKEKLVSTVRKCLAG